jgi:hypothetical protein
MAVRGDEVANTIEAHVREAVDRMVGELRSSLEDIRVAVDSQLKAAVQSVQADAKSFQLRPQLDQALTDLQSSMTPEPVAAAASEGRADASRVKAAIQTVERGKSQVDVLNSLLEACLGFGSRAALLILKGDAFSGWKGVGFSAAGGNDEMVKRFTAPPGTMSELDTVLREERVVRWDGANLSTRFGVPTAVDAILVPMVIKDKVAAAVYVDVVESDRQKFDDASIELLVFTTGLLIDTLAIRKKTPSPSLSGGEAAATSAFAAVPPPQPPAPPAPAPVAPPVPPPAPPRPAAPSFAPQAAAPESADATVAISAEQMRQMINAAGAPAGGNFGGPRPATGAGVRPVPPPSSATPPLPSPSFNAPSFSAPEPQRPAAPAAPPPSEERPTTQYVPPAGVGRGGFSTPQGEEAKKHDEARRFARLLVSEIKLYNESKVDQGRKNKDLYERLKEDIDRSRQMYDERIGEDVRKVSNYFYDELVRILADGNGDAMGL